MYCPFHLLGPLDFSWNWHFGQPVSLVMSRWGCLPATQAPVGPREPCPSISFNRPLFSSLSILLPTFLILSPYSPQSSYPQISIIMPRQFFVGGNFKMYVFSTPLPRVSSMDYPSIVEAQAPVSRHPRPSQLTSRTGTVLLRASPTS